MKINYFSIIVFAIILGFICAIFVIHNYNEENIIFDSNIFFLQVGTYSNIDTSNKKLKNIINKITLKENGKYNSYIGMTSSLSLAEKIKSLYKKDNIDVYIKKVSIDNYDFYNQLKQYDILINNSDNLDEINSVLKTVLAIYEDFLNNL